MNEIHSRAYNANSLGCVLSHNLKPVSDSGDVRGEFRFECSNKNCGHRVVKTKNKTLKSYDWVNHR